MGYCPRCGENSVTGQASVEAEGRPTLPAIHIPRDSLIVRLPIEPGAETVTYGGARFRVTVEGGDYLLRPIE